MFGRDRVGPVQPPQQGRSNTPQWLESGQIHLWPAVLTIAVEEQDPAQHFPTGAWLGRETSDQPMLVHVAGEQPSHTCERHDRGIAGLGDTLLELIVADLP